MVARRGLWIWLKNEIDWYKEVFRLQREKRAKRRAIKLAELRHKADGKRYYVLPDWNGNLKALNHLEINELKRQGVMSKNVNIKNLMEEAVYYTK